MNEKLYRVDQFYPGDFASILTGVYNIAHHTTSSHEGYDFIRSDEEVFTGEIDSGT